MKAFYDEDCGLCTKSMAWLTERTSGVSFHPLEEASASVVVELDDGATFHSARAVAALLRSCGGTWRVVATVMVWPGVRLFSELFYRVIAANRGRISRAFGWTSCAVPRGHLVVPRGMSTDFNSDLDERRCRIAAEVCGRRFGDLTVLDAAVEVQQFFD